MPLSIQAKILRTLQNSEIRRLGGNETIKVNVRFIAATNKDLVELIRDGHSARTSTTGSTRPCSPSPRSGSARTTSPPGRAFPFGAQLGDPPPLRAQKS